MAKIDSVYDFSDKALVELKSWLEPWFRDTTKETVTPSFPAAVAALAATRDLRGYWRLGDGASPFADTSGHPYGPANAVKVVTGTAMTDSITGALPAADDDGAVQFNSLTTGDYLRASEVGGHPTRFNFDNTDSATGAMTVAAWIKPTASSTTYPVTAVGQYRYTTTECGWRIGLNYSALTPFFQRRVNSGTNVAVTGSALTADKWVFVVGTYDLAAGACLYVNGVLAATDATVFGGLPAFNQGVFFGNGQTPGAGSNGFLGGVDEVTVWGAALTPAEVATLYQSGVGAPPGVGTFWFHGSGVPAGGLGSDGAYYLDTALGDVWFKASGAWTMIWDEP